MATAIHARYVPIDTEPQSPGISSFTVLRLADQRTFLATIIPQTRVPFQGGETKLANALLPTVTTPLSHILNHPNIISLVDIIQSSQLPGIPVYSDTTPSDFTVWEDMNAGSLAYILPSLDQMPEFNDVPAWQALAAPNTNLESLPEGLCWHVLRSIAKALLWLHHGVKETAAGRWEKIDDDWQPILIRDVSPGQVWFKHPVGAESYGECKLGGFGSAKVTGTPLAMSAETKTFKAASRDKQHFWAPEIYNETGPWSTKSEIWSLGAVLYHMMTGMPPPRYCEYTWQVSRLADIGYSRMLRETVGEMLMMDAEKRPGARELVEKVEELWRVWRSTTQAGNEFVDVGDEKLFKQFVGSAGIL